VNIQRAKQLLSRDGFDGLLASSPENVLYFTGFPATLHARNRIFFLLKNESPVVALLTPDRPVQVVFKKSGLAVAERFAFTKAFTTYTSQDAGFVGDVETTVSGMACIKTVGDLLVEDSLSRGKIGIEESMPAFFLDALRGRFPDAKFTYGSKLFSEIRMVKMPEEIGRLRRATMMCEEALGSALVSIREGVTETQIQTAFKQYLVSNGGDWTNTKVAAGPLSHVFSHQGTDYPVKKGDIVLFNVGASYGGYACDIARVAVVGGRLTPEAQRMFETLRDAQRAAVKKVRPGLPVSDVFKVAVDHVQNTGYANYSRDFVGHGVGVELHEEPFLSDRRSWRFEPNMVFTVEVPNYDAKLGGFNTEDMILTTSEGYEELSTLSRDLHPVG